MKIQKYKANIIGSNKEAIGYISEHRTWLGSGCWSNEVNYIISITEFSMPNSELRGCYPVIKESIKEFN